MDYNDSLISVWEQADHDADDSEEAFLNLFQLEENNSAVEMIQVQIE